MNRRNFLHGSLATALIAGTRPWQTGTSHHIDRVGVQLYTVRDLMKQDFEGTIAKIAAIGYKEVEFAGYLDKSPKEVRAIVDRHNLTAPSAHISYETVDKRWPQTLEAAATVGHSYLVCPWVEVSQREQPDGWKRAADLFNSAGEASQKADIQFAYHNHAFEFQPANSLGGKLPYDFLLKETDPKFVKMEMDLCWITAGGGDPVSYFNRYPGRFPLVHVKDWIKTGTPPSDYGGALPPSVKQGHMANVGQGDVDWKSIFAHSSTAGIQHYFVENDEPKSPLKDLQISYEYLAKLSF